MKASDLKRVSELVDTYSHALDTLARFQAVPASARQIHVLIRWPNPDPKAPAHQREITFGVFLPMDDRDKNPVMEAIRRQLRDEVAVPSTELRALGVNPDA